MRCACSVLMYRNNHDGTRSHKVTGKMYCHRCHGYGKILLCVECSGAGMLPGSKKCEKCHATGFVPDKSRD